MCSKRTAWDHCYFYDQQQKRSRAFVSNPNQYRLIVKPMNVIIIIPTTIFLLI